MKISIKGIFHERIEDAPFIGALVCATNCNNNCYNCFNQHLKSDPILKTEDQKIINEILSNPFNKGIIFGGLEWTLQIGELKQLIKLGKENNLQIMLYTGLEEGDFKDKFFEIYNIPNIYIKFGKYNEREKCENNIQFGVKLASKNQKIIYTKGGF